MPNSKQVGAAITNPNTVATVHISLLRFGDSGKRGLQIFMYLSMAIRIKMNDEALVKADSEYRKALHATGLKKV